MSPCWCAAAAARSPPVRRRARRPPALPAAEPFSAAACGPIFGAMPKPPKKPKKPKDPARPTRAKAAAEHMKPLAPALAELLNPGLTKGTAGVGAQTGLQPPADNSFDRRADNARAHTARKS